MLRKLTSQPTRVLMTLDAVGGIWRYAMDLAAAMAGQGIETVFVGLGPQPSVHQRGEAERLGRLEWLDVPLDWLVEDPTELDRLPGQLAELVERHGIDLIHLNLPTQACGLQVNCPVVVASHSCVATWFRAVHGRDLPDGWAWQQQRNAAGLQRADAVLVPSRSHAAMLEACYGAIAGLAVVPNSTTPLRGARSKDPFVLAAGRWWDEGKNGGVLETAAGWLDWPLLMAGATRGPNGQDFGIRRAWALGELPGGRLAALMAKAGIVASPSVYEPFGLVALEAASAGACLVLADIPTYRELWDGAAMFVPPRDAAAWTDAINGLARDPGRRAQLGQAAQARAIRFTPAAQLEGVLAAYASAMSRFPAHRLVA